MQTKLNDSSEFSKRLTPSTTMSASPNSECRFYQNPRNHAKRKLLKEYQEKILLLFSMVCRKRKEVYDRWAVLKKRRRKNLFRLRISIDRNKRIEDEIEEIQSRREDSIGNVAEMVDVEETEQRISMMEISYSVGLDELEKIKQKVVEEQLKKELTENTISGINRSLLKAYNDFHENQKSLRETLILKKKNSESLENIRKNLAKINNDSKEIVVIDSENCGKKNKLVEIQNRIEAQVLRLNKLGECFEKVKIIISDNRESLRKMQDCYQGVVERVKEKILSFEKLLDKIQTQEQLVTLKRCKLRKNSTGICDKNKEIIEMIKAVDLKASEIDAESEKCLRRQQGLQERIMEIKVYREKQERLNYLKEKLSQRNNYK